MSGTTRYAEALTALENGQTVITGSQRLARELALEFADRESATADVWERPQIFPWPEWLRELWRELQWQSPDASALALAGPGRRRLLWEQVVSEGVGTESLHRSHSLARSAGDAWDLVGEWQIGAEELALNASEDGSRFLDWVAEYERRCEAGGWLDATRLPDLLLERLPRAKPGVLPKALLMLGFDELTPRQQALLEVVRACGVSVTLGAAAKPGRVLVSACADAESELRAAASWARATLGDDPGATIGIVVPDLATRHEEVARLLAETLTPADSEQFDETGPAVFSVSAGRSLATYPLLNAALNLLSLVRGQVSWTRVSQFLRSPSAGDWAHEAGARALLDVQLRESAGIHWSLWQVASELKRAQAAGGAWQCDSLLARLEEAGRHREAWPETQPLRGWITTLSDWLGIMGWPGERTLTSEEFQLQERWRSLLEELAGLDDLLGSIDFEAALGLIRNHAHATSFKPESGRAPILALGVLEAAGLEFDYLWVCGLHDGAWPPAPAPIPFIPHHLQRERMLPHGSAARELAYAKIQLERLVNSAAEVRLSYPQLHDDEMLRPSPLLAAFDRSDAADASTIGIHQRVLELHEYRPQLDKIVDGVGPGWHAGAAPGGVRLLELQAHCPFRAFAELRLGAERLEQPVAGLDPRQRGQLAHDGLRRIWEQLPDQGALLELDEPARADLVRSALAAAARRLRGVADDPVRRASLAIEQEVLQALLLQLLHLECERATFEVAANEQRYEVDLAGLSLTVRPDRVDRLPNGHLVIDYKTGAVKTADWFGNRPRAPQLPLYATALGFADVRGVAFVQLRAGELRFMGVSEDDEAMPAGVRPLSERQRQAQQVDNWPGMLKSWQTVLHTLAQEFAAGKACVDPLKYACNHCHLAGLCRLEEKKRSGEVDPDV